MGEQDDEFNVAAPKEITGKLRHAIQQDYTIAQLREQIARLTAELEGAKAAGSAHHAEMMAATAERDEALRWKDRLVDAAVVYWCLTEENEGDPQKLLSDVIQTAIDWENDPAISERAARDKAALDAANEDAERMALALEQVETRAIPEGRGPVPWSTSRAAVYKIVTDALTTHAQGSGET